VDLVGPSSLITLMENVPPYWVPILPLLTNRVGDPNTDEGRKLLEERSPLTHVDRICRPLLIAQGAQDPRVKQIESDQIVREMKEKQIPVTYLLYPDEGHGFVRPENKLSFFAVMELFLAQHLGGRSEPLGDAFSGSSIQVVEGAKDLPELEKATKK
jgi:acetyl esterase/lipase